MKTSVAILIIVLAVVAVFLPGVSPEFVGWDDNVMVFDNPLIKKLDLRSAGEIFSRFYYAPYVPLVLLSYSLEYHFFKLDAVFYHLTNLLLHALAAVLVFLLLKKLGASAPASLAAALFFGIHPLRVESVVWITERKDVLSGVFFLLALLAYLRVLGRREAANDAERRRPLWYALTLVLFLLSLLSKPTVAPFPLVLILIDWLEGRKISPGSIAGKIPFFLLAIAFSAVAVIVQYSPGAEQSSLKAGWTDPLIGLTNIIFYLGKTLFPIRLSAFYSYPRPISLFLPGFLFPLLLLGALAALVVRSLRFTRVVAAAAVFFLVMLLPVLKLLPFGEEFARADRYTYLPSVGLAALVGIGGELAWRSGRRGIKTILIFAGTLSALFLALLSGARSTIWSDTVTLFTDVLRKHPGVAVAYANMGTAYGHRGQYEKELECYRRYLEIRPHRKQIYQNVALAYQQMGDYEKEADAYRVLLEDQGESPRLYNLLGVALGRLEKYREAIACFERAVNLKPDDAEVYNNLGLALGYLGYLDQSREAFQTAIRLEPALPEAHANLAELYRAMGKGK
ncbi:MAG: tetratricopeptide repeat protein [Candidatus Aureabacteria bacterium]|nr:tetratricopeptide repeat protein [Candidatus Auribacterota bacterium]